jgi:hypothetical protein
MLQNIEYAVPPFSVQIQCSAALESSLSLGGTYTAFTSNLVTGCFVKCTTGNSTVTLQKNGVS